MLKQLSLYGGDVLLDFDEAAHAYKWAGKFVPGVTRVLQILNKPALVQWSANCAVQYITDGYKAKLEAGDELELSSFLSLCQEAKTAHRRISKEATDVGSLVHQFAERVLVDRRAALPSDPQAAKGAEAFLSWFHAHDIEPIHVERMILSRHWYYAGTVDFFGKIDGELCVLDFKTSSGLYLEMLLQLAAYAVALEEETGERIEDGLVIHLDKKTGKPTPYPVPITRGLKDSWLRVREAYEAIQKTRQMVKEMKRGTANAKAA